MLTVSESAPSSAQADITAEKNMSTADDVIVMYYFLKVKFEAKICF